MVDAARMIHRTAIAALWFVSFFCLHELAWSVFGSPRLLGILVGGVAAAFFYFDPFRLFAAAPSAGPDVGVNQRLAPPEGAVLTR